MGRPQVDPDWRKKMHQRGQKRAIARRKCPKCGRGNALTRDVWADQNGRIGWLGKHCRYCDYETGNWVG